MKNLYGIYRWLYGHTTGRPWTYVTRAWTQQRPRWTAFWVMLGLGLDGAGIALAAHLLSAPWVIVVAMANTGLGVIAGHVWWDTTGAYLGGADDA